MADKKGFSVRVFMPSGEPEGLRLIEKSNWTGHGVVFPRSLVAEARQRAELQRAGVYVLWGHDETGQPPQVYIGEGDCILPRLDMHVRNKEFWTHAVVFTSKDQNLNKAHVQYLESRLVALANDAKRCELDNANTPKLPALSEVDAVDTEGFLEDLLLCLPVVGVNFFEQAKAGRRKGPKLFIKAKGITASGVDSPEGFVVFSGSQAAREEAKSIQQFLKDLRRTLIEKGVMIDEGGSYKFIQNYVFNSPSTASGVVLGRSSNGRTEWKNDKGRTLKVIQDSAGVTKDATT